MFNPIALRTVKTPQSFGRSECNSVKIIVSSFSITHGISLHLNGHLLGSQTKPTIQPALAASLKPGISIGMCLPPLVGGPVNMAVSGLVSAGLHLAGLAANGLMRE